MSEKGRETGAQPEAQDSKAVDSSRRRFTRLGLGSAPVIMTLASQPVLGGNCLSNALSGNLSDPDRGVCVLGLSVAAVAALDRWGVFNPDRDMLQSTPLAGAPMFVSMDMGMSLRRIIAHGGDKAIVLAAWVNTMVTPDYVMTEAQLLQLLDGSLPVPGVIGLIEYLESTLQV